MKFNASEIRGLLDNYGHFQGPDSTPGHAREYIQTLTLIAIAEELQGIGESAQMMVDYLANIESTLQAGLGVESGEAVSAKLITGGMQMSTSAPGTGQITVDTANSTVTLAFYDDKGDVAQTPAGASVAFSVDNPGVLTVATDAANPLQGDITPVAEGSANISASVTGATAPDGSAFTVSPVAVSVVAGPAESAGLALQVPGQ